jgi:hypothetical protein
MATTSTATAFDTAAFRRAIESRDAGAQLELYADDARAELVDRENPPSRPRVTSGRDELRDYLEDVTSRDMTHEVSSLVVDGDSGAFTVDCLYPDGTRVLCMATIALRGGRIAGQRCVQVWDE